MIAKGSSYTVSVSTVLLLSGALFCAERTYTEFFKPTPATGDLAGSSSLFDLKEEPPAAGTSQGPDAAWKEAARLELERLGTPTSKSGTTSTIGANLFPALLAMGLEGGGPARARTLGNADVQI